MRLQTVGCDDGPRREDRPSAAGGPHSVANFRSDHDGGGHFLFGDGAVHFVSEDIDHKLYRGMSTIGGHEVISWP